VKIDFWNGSVDGLLVGYRVRSPYDTATSGMSFRQLEEMPNSQVTNVALGATERVAFQGTVDFAQVMGWNREQLAATQPGPTSANASYGDIFLDTFVIDLNNNTSRTMEYQVSVEYTVQMSGYVAPAES